MERLDRSQVSFRLEGPDAFDAHGTVPIAFQVDRTVDLDLLLVSEGREVAGVACDPRIKDYDAVEAERPSAYADRHGAADWVLVSAFGAGQRAGGTVVAPTTVGFGFADERKNAAVLVDLRVEPRLRGHGLGRKLVERAADLARQWGRAWLLVETQDTNFAACRLYSARGFQVFTIDRLAYGEDSDEALVAWELEL